MRTKFQAQQKATPVALAAQRGEVKERPCGHVVNRHVIHGSDWSIGKDRRSLPDLPETRRAVLREVLAHSVSEMVEAAKL